MAGMVHCDLSQLEAYSKALKVFSESEIDRLFVSCSKALAARLLALVIPKTPVGVYPPSSGKVGGTLRRGWTGNAKESAVGYAAGLPVYKRGTDYVVDIINPVEYASYVEYGHRTVSGGWVPGRYMLTISEKSLQSMAPRVLENLILQKMRGL